jgi:hypothetical protein
MNEKTKKRLKSAGAITLAAALLLTGTFAWSYVSSPVTNEAYGTVNPGGRLHDDFDGKDKDIYVENFGEQNIYARVKLTEYMEIGKNANKDRETESGGGTRTDVTPVVTGSKLTDKSTWTTYFKDEEKANRALLDAYFTLDTSGGKTVYMPTFNKNKDSLFSDVNGRYENEIGGSFSYTDYLDGSHYTDHTDYTVGQTAQGFEIIDADDNTTDEISTEKTVYDATHTTDMEVLKGLIGNYLDTNVKVNKTVIDDTNPDALVTTYEPVVHEAKETVEAAALITMDEYIAMSEADRKAYVGWVADGADGWAYWSQPIAPNTATGLLITSIGDLKTETNDPWYLAIDAEAQFITVSDMFNEGTTGEDEPSEEAYALLRTLGLTNFQMSDAARTVVNSINAIDSANIGKSTATVEIDGVNYIVVDRGADSAILLQQNVDANESSFGTSNQWKGSTIETYLNSTEEGGYLNGKTTLQELIGDGVTIKTATAYDRGTDNTYAETTDKVFLLSEADVFGTANGVETKNLSEYTNGTGKLNIDKSVLKTGSWWWLRSPKGSAGNVAIVYSDGVSSNYDCNVADGGVRPALIVNL